MLAARAKNLPTPPPQLKIEIPANRYDLLCVEGIAKALRVFLGLEKTTHYTLSSPAKMEELYVEASVSFELHMNGQADSTDFTASTLRCCCHLALSSTYESSSVRFVHRPAGQAAYESLQAEATGQYGDTRSGHHRGAVPVSTAVQSSGRADFRYVCEDPKTIKFAPLNKDQEYTGEELMTLYDVSILSS